MSAKGFFFHAPVPPDTTRDNFDFVGLLHETAGFKFACEFDHLGFWEMRVAVADRYQQGRAFIAGDAAHSHPPYGGFGLNSGLEDAVNLGWKLAARLQGWGGDALLASYSEERRPIFHEIAEDFIAKRIRNDARFLHAPQSEPRPGGIRAGLERATHRSRRPRAGLRAGLRGLADRDRARRAARPPRTATTRFKARSGHHLPPQKLSSGRNVFEELGRGSRCLLSARTMVRSRAFEQAARTLNVPFKVGPR